jgi:Xaa-Pro aminopeptidase
MKSDLDAILAQYDLDALLVTGPAFHNPVMVYLTGGGHVTQADLIRKRGERGTLFFGPMEREEAAKSGLALISYTQYPWRELVQQANGSYAGALALRYQRMLQDVHLTHGRVGLYGITDAGSALEVFRRVEAAMPGLHFIGDPGNEVLQQVMATKDDDEVARIRRMGEGTVSVVARTAEYLSNQHADGECLVHADGSPVTIGEVKSKINLWLTEGGVENPEGTIFSIGHDAGVPHSSGNPTDAIRLGQPIVFDIFPCESGGGYYYDLTRTWCMGYAPPEVQRLYDQVRLVYDTVVSELEVGQAFKHYQDRVCEMFEELGHATVRQDPAVHEGYVHGLGHGVGLNIHEKPISSSMASGEDVLAAGSVITIEPGLYYPSRGMGVRLENTLWVRPDGTFETLAACPMDLVLPVRG